MSASQTLIWSSQMLVSTWRAQWRGLQSAVALNEAYQEAGLGCGLSSGRTVVHICHANTAVAVLSMTEMRR